MEKKKAGKKQRERGGGVVDLYFPFLCNPLLHFLSKYLCGETAETSSYCTNTEKDISSMPVYTYTNTEYTRTTCETTDGERGPPEH